MLEHHLHVDHFRGIYIGGKLVHPHQLSDTVLPFTGRSITDVSPKCLSTIEVNKHTLIVNTPSASGLNTYILHPYPVDTSEDVAKLCKS